MTLKQIRKALKRLDSKIPQLPGLSFSAQIYSDGSGFILDGRGNELQPFMTEDEIVLAADAVLNSKEKLR